MWNEKQEKVDYFLQYKRLHYSNPRSSEILRLFQQYNLFSIA